MAGKPRKLTVSLSPEAIATLDRIWDCLNRKSLPLRPYERYTFAMAETAAILNLPTDPETTGELKRAMAQAEARGLSLGKYLKSVLPEESASSMQNGMPIEEWKRSFLEWVNSRPGYGTHVDDSRESIYGPDDES
jgi:hypothetical protein